DRGLVTRLLECLRQQPLVRGKPVGVRRRDDDGLQAIAKRVAAGHEARPRRRTHRLSVKLFEPYPACSELVDVWRLDVRAVKPDILPPEVVREDVNDVRMGSGRLRRSPWGGRKAGEKHHQPGKNTELTLLHISPAVGRKSLWRQDRGYPCDATKCGRTGAFYASCPPWWAARVAQGDGSPIVDP